MTLQTPLQPTLLNQLHLHIIIATLRFYISYMRTDETATPNSPYLNYWLQVWNTSSMSVIYNATIAGANCWIRCEIEATRMFFLVEGANHVQIFRMSLDFLTPISLIIDENKPAPNAFGTVINRQADIFDSMSVNADGNSIKFTKILSNTSNVTIYYNYPSAYQNGSNTILFTGITQFGASLVIKNTLKPNPVGFIFNCVPCIFNYTYTSGQTINNTLALQYEFKFSTEYVKFDQGNLLDTNTTINWLLVSGQDTKIRLNNLNITYITNTSGYQNYASNHKIIGLYPGSNMLYIYDFSLNNQSSTNLTFSRYSKITNVAFNNDSTKLAIASINDNQITQYQIVDDCTKYQTISTTDHFCECIATQQNGLCQLKSNSSDVPISSVLIIIGVVLLVIMIVISIVIYKKCFSKSSKNPRKPWKYNPVELVSFQM